MATLTKAQLASRVLENLGILAQGQTATSNDSDLVQEAIDSAHDRLKKEGLAPFATSAIPMWAQIPLRDYVSAELVSTYGITGERLQIILNARREAVRQLTIQVSADAGETPTRPYWF